jgi:hypothetical protein
MLQKGESSEHRRIKLKMKSSFLSKGWIVKSVDGEGEETEVVNNGSNIGDGENKRPDIDAKNGARIIRGEVKINNGDFDTKHSITQYKLFSNLSLKGVDSWLIIGVPIKTKNELMRVLNDNLAEEQLGRIAVWEF